MLKKAVLIAVVMVVVAMAYTHWFYSDRGRFTTEPEYTDLDRTLSGNDLISDHDPAVILRFGPTFRHIGGQKFILYGVADTEQHFFVETTPDDKLKSVYWVQYEAYLPDNYYSYDYEDSPLRVTLDDYEFYTDTAAVTFDPDKKRARGTDGALARQLLASKGYVFPNNFAYARLVYLTDESRRKELMIIFIADLVIDDLESHGFSAAELVEGGAEASRWPEVERAHLDRIKNTLTVLTVSKQ